MEATKNPMFIPGAQDLSQRWVRWGWKETGAEESSGLGKGMDFTMSEEILEEFWKQGYGKNEFAFFGNHSRRRTENGMKKGETIK